MATATVLKNKGPWSHRLLIGLFLAGLTLLSYWLLGFVLDDIGAWPGPSYEKLESEQLDKQLLSQQAQLAEKAEAIERAISDQRERQSLLQESTLNSQRTMKQLIELRQSSLDKGVTPSAEEQKALAESQQMFLANQKQFQELNEREVKLKEELRERQREQQQVSARLETLRQPIRDEFARLQQAHEFKIALAKLAFLLPLLLLAVGAFLRSRGTLYAPLAYAFGIAVIIRVVEVMHEYFPSRYFKYVLILAALIITLRILIWLLRMSAHPRPDWLLKQYREAYEAFLCPKCSYPIRRGPLKYLIWTRRSLSKLAVSPAGPDAVDEPYTCPMCSTRLFEECPECHAMRHSLLPACQRCGTIKAMAATA